MRTIQLAAAALLFSTAVFADDYRTRDYVRRDGTPVQGHMNSGPNENRYDNYSSRGNTNPYTGERGSQRNEYTNPPEYNTGRRRDSDNNSNSYGSGNTNNSGDRRRR